MSQNAMSAMFENETLLRKLDTESGRAKYAQFTSHLIRDQIREGSFANLIIPPEQVTPADRGVQVSTHHDGLVKIVEIEPRSWAMTLNFRDTPAAEIIEGDRVEVGFWTIGSPIYEKPEQELRAYSMSITSWIEENIPKDLEAIVDRTFLLYVEMACQAMQTSINATTTVEFDRTHILAGDVNAKSVRIAKGEQALVASTAADDFTVRTSQFTDYIKLKNLLEKNKKFCDRLLLNYSDANEWSGWIMDDMGSKLKSESVINGYNYNTMNGLNYTRTIKSDILRPGNIYAFTKPDFLGVNFVLENLKFFVEKKIRLLSWQAQMDIGMAIINCSSVAKLELYQASARPTAPGAAAGGTTIDDVLPFDEENINLRTHRVPEGDVFPDIQQY